MSTIHLKVITPKKVVMDENVSFAVLPASEGYVTILPRHTHLFSLLSEGIIVINKNGEEDFLAIGGGYLDTDGENLHILVSRAYKQDEIDEQMTKKALESAQKVLSDVKETAQRREAARIVRRSLLDLKLLKKRKRKTSSCRAR